MPGTLGTGGNLLKAGGSPKQLAVMPVSSNRSLLPRRSFFYNSQVNMNLNINGQMVMGRNAHENRNNVIGG